MERRKFLSTTAAATSVCAITGGVALAGTSAAKDEKKSLLNAKLQY